MSEEKKLQVFISSTRDDMIEERQCVVETLLEMGHIPAGMELFSADNKRQFEVIKKWIDNSDIFLLILGGRYGSIEPKTGRGYVYMEYQYAKRLGKKPITILLSDLGIQEKINKGLYSKTTPEYLQKEYIDFKESIKTNRLCDFFDDIADLKNAVNKALRNCEKNIDHYSGWVKGGSVTRDPETIHYDPGYFNQYNNRLKQCLDKGIYDEYMTRIILITLDKSKKVFEIKSTWKFKTYSFNVNSPLFYFDYNSESKLVFDTFELTYFEMNGQQYTDDLKKNVKKMQDTRNGRYYCYLEKNLILDKNYAVEVECTYTYHEPLALLHYYASFMYPSRARNLQIILQGTDDWGITAGMFTSFKNMGTNVNAIYSGRSNYIESKDKSSYTAIINDWTLPGTGYYYMIHKLDTNI